MPALRLPVRASCATPEAVPEPTVRQGMALGGEAMMDATEYVRYRANVTSLAKGGWTVDATVEIVAGPGSIAGGYDVETELLARLRSFVDKLRAEYPAQAVEK